jgi:hypothetical protein
VKAQGEPPISVGSTGPTGWSSERLKEDQHFVVGSTGPDGLDRLEQLLCLQRRVLNKLGVYGNPSPPTQPLTHSQNLLFESGTVRVVLAQTFSVSNTQDCRASRPQREAPRAPDRLVSARTCLRCKEATYRPLTDWRIDSLTSKGGLLPCRGGSVES